MSNPDPTVGGRETCVAIVAFSLAILLLVATIAMVVEAYR